MRPLSEVLFRLRRRRRSHQEREATRPLLVLWQDARRWYGLPEPALGPRNVLDPSVSQEQTWPGGEMDTRQFVEVIRADEFLLIVRVGNWFHKLDKETGEGEWEWHGPDSYATPRPEKFS